MSIIVVGIIAYANPDLWEGVKQILKGQNQINNSETIKPEILLGQDQLISKCRNSFNECVGIYNKKFGLSVFVSQIEQVSNLNEANKFYDIWKGRLEDYNRIGKLIREREINDTGFPQTLIAYSIKWPDKNVKLPSLVTCNQGGELIQSSKTQLSCG